MYWDVWLVVTLRSSLRLNRDMFEITGMLFSGETSEKLEISGRLSVTVESQKRSPWDTFEIPEVIFPLEAGEFSKSPFDLYLTSLMSRKDDWEITIRGRPIYRFCRLIVTDSWLLELSAKIHAYSFPGCVCCWSGLEGSAVIIQCESSL